MSGRALITGATGFVGGALVDALRADGVAVRALVRDRRRAEARWGAAVEVVEHDLAGGAELSGACRGIDVVFHLAGHAHAEDEGSGRSDALHQAVTVEGTRALLADARRHGVARVVLLSSVKAIGEGTGPNADDGAAPAPGSAYGRAKLAAERLVLGGGARPDGAVVRSPLVYGPGVKGNLAAMLAAIARGRFPPPPEVGNRRSMIDVRDLVAALRLVAVAPAAAGRAVIATDGEAYSTRRIHDAMCAALGRPVPRWSVPLAALRAGALAGDALGAALGRPMPLTRERLRKLLGHAHYDGAALRALGFSPDYRLETALPDVVAAWRRGA